MASHRVYAVVCTLIVAVVDLTLHWGDWLSLFLLAAIGGASFMAGRSAPQFLGKK